MFALHETTRSALCRMGFLVLCVLPICAILAAAGWLRSDVCRAIHERELSGQLGLAVSCDRVLLTHPEGLRYEGIVLADPETGAEIASASWLNVSKHDDAMFVGLGAAELNGSRIDCLRDLLMRQLRTGKPGKRVLAVSPKLTMRMLDKSQFVLEDVSAQFDFARDKAQVVVDFQPVDRQGRKKVELGVMRNRRTTPPSTTIAVDTKSSTLPCSLVSAFFPVLARLGPASRFQGGMLMFESPQGWNGHFEGKFVNVDLASLVTHQYSRQLTGTAQIRIQAAKISAGRIEQMRGELTSGAGVIHQEFVKSMTNRFNLSTSRVKSTLGESHPFSELAFAFAMDAMGLLIKGKCQSATPGAVLVDQKGVAIGEPTPAIRLPLAIVEEAFSSSRAALISVLPIADDGRKRR